MDPESKFLGLTLPLSDSFYKLALNYFIYLSFYKSSLIRSDAPILCPPSYIDLWKSAVFRLLST